MSKVNKPGPEYSREREWKVILEELQGQFRVFGEDLQTVHRKLDALEELPQQVRQLQTDMIDVKANLKEVNQNLNFVNRILPTLATKDDLIPIGRRLTALEAR